MYRFQESLLMVRVMHSVEMSEKLMDFFGLLRTELPECCVQIDPQLGITVVTPDGVFGVEADVSIKSGQLELRKEFSRVCPGEPWVE